MLHQFDVAIHRILCNDLTIVHSTRCNGHRIDHKLLNQLNCTMKGMPVLIQFRQDLFGEDQNFVNVLFPTNALRMVQWMNLQFRLDSGTKMLLKKRMFKYKKKMKKDYFVVDQHNLKMFTFLLATVQRTVRLSIISICLDDNGASGLFLFSHCNNFC